MIPNRAEVLNTKGISNRKGTNKTPPNSVFTASQFQVDQVRETLFQDENFRLERASATDHG